MFSRTISLSATMAGLASAVISVSAQTTNIPLISRFDEDRFRQSLELDTSRPMFADDERTRTAFQSGGEWSLKLNSNAVYDTNAFRNSLSRDDWHWDYGASLQYDWWVSESSGIVVSPNLSIGGQHYDTFDELDGEMLGAGLAVSFTKLPFKPELSYAGGWGFESGFEDHNYTEQVLELAIGHQIPLAKDGSGKPDANGPVLAFRLASGYQFTEPSVLDAASVSGGVDLSVPLTEKLTFGLGGGIAFRSYSDFEPQDRDTWLASASASLAWKITETLALVGAVNFTNADDRISAKDYDRLASTISLKYTQKGFRLFGLPKESYTPTAPYPKAGSSK